MKIYAEVILRDQFWATLRKSVDCSMLSHLDDNGYMTSLRSPKFASQT